MAAFRCAGCDAVFDGDQVDGRECNMCHEFFCDECSFTAHDSQDIIGVNDVDWCNRCWELACDQADAWLTSVLKHERNVCDATRARPAVLREDCRECDAKVTR